MSMIHRYYPLSLPIALFQKNSALSAFFSAALCVPITLFTVFNYDINPTFVLGPAIFFSIFCTRTPLQRLFFIAAITGTISIVLSQYILQDINYKRHFLNLGLILFSPGFVFLGRWLMEKGSLIKLHFWLSVFSSIFLLCITSRIISLGEPVRLYVQDEFATMNAIFLGVPVFASFGVLSLADLILLQATLITGSIISSHTSIFLRFVFFLSLAAAIFLVIGSDSRSCQLIMLLLISSLTIDAWRHPARRRNALAAVLIITAAIMFSVQWMNDESRLTQSISKVFTDKTLLDHLKHSAGQTGIDANTFSSGRVQLIKTAVSEVSKSPLIGNGFSGFGRYNHNDNLKKDVGTNTSTHVYYLTLLWKGGLIFFLPFITFLGFTFREALRSRQYLSRCSEVWYMWTAVFIAFGPMCFAWDILMVPSAGALAFFLLGVLSAYNDQETGKGTLSDCHIAKLQTA